MLFVAESFGSHGFAEAVFLISFVFKIAMGLTTPFFMLVAAWFLLRCPSKWPAYVIGASAVYFALAHSLYLTMDPTLEKMLGFGMSSATYMKLIPVLTVSGWVVGIINGTAIVTVCRRLAAASRLADRPVTD